MAVGSVTVFSTIADLRGNTADLSSVALVVVKGYHAAKGPGGGVFVPGTGTDDGVLTFVAGPVSSPTVWRRQLDGDTIDSYMAGAHGDGVIDDDGVVDTGMGTNDDSDAIQELFDLLRESAKPPVGTASTNSARLHIRIGDGAFRVDKTLDLTSFPGGAHGWVIDGTGAALLGACTGTPVIDMTDSRFGAVVNLQITGSAPSGPPGADHVPSCGIRVGRNANNSAANQMTMDHVGIRGHFKLAAMLNVGSEQFAAIGCEFANDREGETYGYAGDGFNCL